MASYYEIPAEFVLAPNPQFQLLSLNQITFFTSDLTNGIANCVIADPKCDKLKMIIRRGQGQLEESLTLLCASEVDNLIVPPEAGLNLHTESHRWLYKRGGNSKGLCLVFLSEDHHARVNLTANFNTYIKLLKPDVVVVSEGVFATGMHKKLLDVYTRYCRAQLLNEGNNVFWVYHNPTEVSVVVAMEVAFGFVNIERLAPPANGVNEVEPAMANV